MSTGREEDAIQFVPSQFEVVHTPPPILSFRVQNPLTVPYGDIACVPFEGGEPGIYALKWQGHDSSYPDLRRFLHGKPGGFRSHAFGKFDGIFKLGKWNAETDTQDASITLGTDMPVRVHAIIYSGTERANTDTYGAIPLFVEVSFGEAEYYTPLIWEVISPFSLVYRNFDPLKVLAHEMQERLRMGYPTKSTLLAIESPTSVPPTPQEVQAAFPLFSKIPAPPRRHRKRDHGLATRPYHSDPLPRIGSNYASGINDDTLDESDVILCDAKDSPSHALQGENLRSLEPQFPNVIARNLFEFEVPLAGIFYASLNEKAQEDILSGDGILNITS